jgi:hypothetical protein
MQTFEDWLEERYPSHSEYDFNCKADYSHWVWMNKVAYIAGWDACHEDAKEWDASVSYVDALNANTKASKWAKTSAMNWND